MEGNLPLQSKLGPLWRAWELLTEELLRQEKDSLHPYSGTRLLDADGCKRDLLTCVRQAREAAERMRADFPGFQPK